MRGVDASTTRLSGTCAEVVGLDAHTQATARARGLAARQHDVSRGRRLCVCSNAQGGTEGPRRRGEGVGLVGDGDGVVISSEARLGVLFPRCGGGGSGSGHASSVLSRLSLKREGVQCVSRGASSLLHLESTDTSSTPDFANSVARPFQRRQPGSTLKRIVDGARDHRLHDRHPGHGVAVHKEDDCEAVGHPRGTSLPRAATASICDPPPLRCLGDRVSLVPKGAGCDVNAAEVR